MMKRAFALVFSIALTGWVVAAEDDGTPQAPKKDKVTKLDGTSFFGLVEVTDDYTVRVKSDTGITKIPMAMLGEKDFKKYGFGKDRSKDGKFWSERQDALEQEQEKNAEQKDTPDKKKKDDDSMIEVNLSEIAPFQPLIDAYEKSVADKKKTDGDAADKQKGDKPEAETPGRSLFSKTGIPGLGDKPFSGMGTSAVQPATSLGATAVQSTVGAAGLPGLPQAP